MAKKKSVQINESVLPASIRKAMAVSDAALIAEGKASKTSKDKQRDLGAALDAAGFHMFAIVDSQDHAKFDSFWKAKSAMFTKPREEVEQQWLAAREVVLEMRAIHNQLVTENPELPDWGERKQGIGRQMAWCNPSDANKGLEAKERAKRTDTSGGVSLAKLKAGHAKKETKPRKVDPTKAAKSDIDKIGKGLTAIEADYISLVDSYLAEHKVGTEKQRANVRDAIDKVRTALATLEGKI